MRPEIIEQIGNYYVQKCDGAYAMYSGYEHIVCYQPPTICQPKQLAGFGTGRVEDAKAFMRQRAKAGREDAAFRKTKSGVESRLKTGLLPVPFDDSEMRLHLVAEGYTLQSQDRVYQWYAPPKKAEPGLFSTTQPTGPATEGGGDAK